MIIPVICFLIFRLPLYHCELNIFGFYLSQGLLVIPLHRLHMSTKEGLSALNVSHDFLGTAVRGLGK